MIAISRAPQTWLNESSLYPHHPGLNEHAESDRRMRGFPNFGRWRERVKKEVHRCLLVIEVDVVRDVEAASHERSILADLSSSVAMRVRPLVSIPAPS